MSTESSIHASIESTAESVGAVWPLHSFVTANPLAGFEDQPFHEAVEDAQQLLGGDGYPSVEVFRRAVGTGRIDRDVLQNELTTHGYNIDPETALDRMADTETDRPTESVTTMDRVDAVLTKWLAAFLDQGQAKWSMPNREQGFYAAFRAVAAHDSEIPAGVKEIPDKPIEAIQHCLDEYAFGRWNDIFEYHLTALPGWTGFIKQRASKNDAWQSSYPITLHGYLAARLTLVHCFDAPVVPSNASEHDESWAAPDGALPLPEVWLTAWEASYRNELVGSLTNRSEALAEQSKTERPDAQFVFCIDTRSEIIRRHIEATGNYETHGYAGFFGIPMRYDGYGSDVTVDACPPILDATHHIADQPTEQEAGNKDEYDRWQSALGAGKATIRRLESNAATAFSFVESTGIGYGAGLAARTLLPGRVYDLLDRTDETVPDDDEFCEPSVDHDPDATHNLPSGLTLEQKVDYAATAFDLMGWEQFARVVVFAGHASQTANNPFDSSLDCGACAGNPGGPSARVLATIANEDAVKAQLRERGFDIPDDTVFIAGEHNTTTDEVELYTGDVPESHQTDIDQLRTDLGTARAGAASERAGDMGAKTESGVRETERRAADWAETRPEWGLAGNAGFVIGPRELTDGVDLDGRSFLHSYDWRTDSEGDALEAILTGPMVVTQWINTQYYFATIDNATYGSGSKVTHNPVGNIGVYQGNGGDLMSGLPLQSLMSADNELYHQPLRLSTVIHAPVKLINQILSENQQLQELLDNNWLSLTAIDPQQDHRAFHYESDLEWTQLETQTTTPDPTATPSACSD
ncbi:DUF2309 domain-containing protein [Halovenus rubra]|uniref:DUF2309 domain-containing protein n=2 Tax=Halovenus rubra TaxID=869890 RepID=A0ACC7E2X2_9EURY|nr:DUF2309 domain-containing protein [Halovenus rubra]